ncbi:MAG: 16S rRNA (uracil(1498)-N(3))-methyltransferase [Planctomycetota bacterium]|jgi:16S rRNA (uracil1498-N3)-methyltransferase
MKKIKPRSRYSSHSRPQLLHRFFVTAQSLHNKEVVLDNRHAHQIKDVLRLKPGQHIIVLDNQGWQYKLHLTNVGRGVIKGQVVEKRRATGEPRVQITLYQSLLKPDKFEWVLQKCTELGVVRFVPLLTQHSLLRDCKGTKANKLTRWRRIITEAAEQSHRARIPDLKSPIDWERGMAELADYNCSLVASPEAKGKSLRDCLQARRDLGGASVALFVGPEAGFTEDEVKQAQAGGAIPFSLGHRILRTETAALVASSLILYELGEMEG